MRHPHAVALLLAASTTLLPSAARASWTPSGIDLYGSSHSSGPSSFALDGTGGVFTWFDVYAGGATGVSHLDRLKADGTLVDAWTPIDDATTGFATDGAGGFDRAYWRNVSPTQKYDAFLLHNLPDGSVDPAWPGPSHELGVGVTTHYEFAPGLASDGAGGVFCAYIYDAYTGLRAKRVNGNGTFAAGWPAGGVSVDAGLYGPYVLYAPSLFPDGDGGVFIVWQGTQLAVQRLTGSGAIAAGWSAGGIPVSSNSASSEMQVLAFIPSGPDHFFLAWHDADPAREGIWVQRIDRGGFVAPEWPESGVKVVAGNLGGTPFSDGANGFFVHWWDGSTLRVKRLDANGALVAPWPDAGATLATLGDAGNVPVGGAVAVEGPAGGLIACWKDGRYPGNPKWRGRWLLADGSADPSQPDTSRVLVAPQYPATSFAGFPDGHGGLYYDWQEDTGFNWYMVKANWAPYPQTSVGVDPVATRPRVDLAVGPNPARSSLAARFTLGAGDAARVELVDVAGRRVRTRDVSGAGDHVERFEGLGSLSPGVYVVRLTAGGRVRAARVAVLR